MATRTESRTSPQHPINGETLRAAVSGLIDAKIFSGLKVHGNTKWLPLDLILLTIMWVWSDQKTLTGAFDGARRWSLEVLKRVAVSTYQGLLGALETWTDTLLPLVREQLHARMQARGGVHWRIGLWVAFAVDGTRVSTPRSKANEEAFCAPRYGQSAMAKYRRKKRKKDKKRYRLSSKKVRPVKPQIWLTLMWHMGLRLCWTWRTGPSTASERDHFQQMLKDEKFPENSLFCCDAGFTGYELWKLMQDRGHGFVIRVGANVALLRKLGYVKEKPGLVYFWPDRMAKRKQPPLVLRLFSLKVGRCQMWLVSNVLKEEQLSDREAVELYRRRWGVEVQIRALKQTFGRGQLRCETPARALVELHWSLVGLWVIQLFAVEKQVEVGTVPDRCSVSLAIGIVRSIMERWWEYRELSFAEDLRGAMTDGYKRTSSKKARYRPENLKDRPKAGKPKILIAKRKHKQLLKLMPKCAA
jgi:hypothetical protein